jgi:WD40 repeat protein
MSHSRLGLADGWGLLQSMRFNQDRSAFVCAFQDGFRIYNVDPIREKAHFREHQVGSISQAELLYRSNLIAVVSGGRKPKYADNAVMMIDDRLEKAVLEVTLPSPVLAVRLRSDKIIVVCRTAIHVFSFPNSPSKLFSIETRDNALGLCEVSPGKFCERELLVFPGYKVGSIQLIDIQNVSRVSSAPTCLNAHRTELTCLALNQQGTMVATASLKGTLIRIWDTGKRIQLVELRRGADPARIYCINFSLTDEWLCCSSDKGTVHVFALQDYRLNKRSALATMGVPGAYAGSQWSLASFTVPQECACICAFGGQNNIHAVCLDGSYHKYHFSPDGICNQAAYDVITELCEDCDWQTMRHGDPY